MEEPQGRSDMKSSINTELLERVALKLRPVPERIGILVDKMEKEVSEIIFVMGRDMCVPVFISIRKEL